MQKSSCEKCCGQMEFLYRQLKIQSEATWEELLKDNDLDTWEDRLKKVLGSDQPLA